MILSKFNNPYSDFDYVLIYYSGLRICYGYYEGISREVPGGFALFGMILLFWLISNWIVNDTKVTNVTWVSQSRFALFIAWPILVPIYLFQTRKFKAFIEIFCFYAFGAFFHIFGLIAGKLVSA